MPFDVEQFKCNRERVVKLDDGNEVIVRRPAKDMALLMMNAIGHRLDPQTLKAMQQFQAQGEAAAANIDDAEFLQANAADVWRVLLAFIAYSPTEPKFVLDETDEHDGKVWVERLTADDVMAILAPVLEFLGLTLPDVAVSAPFPESSGPEQTGGDMGDSQAEQPATEPASAGDGHTATGVPFEVV
jgi:hypothetical protein